MRWKTACIVWCCNRAQNAIRCQPVFVRYRRLPCLILGVNQYLSKFEEITAVKYFSYVTGSRVAWYKLTAPKEPSSSSFETSVNFYQTTRYHMPEDSIPRVPYTQCSPSFAIFWSNAPILRYVSDNYITYAPDYIFRLYRCLSKKRNVSKEML